MSAFAGMPRSVLVALTACVLTVHLGVLSGAPTRLRVRAPVPMLVPAFTIRRIELPAIEVAPDALETPPRPVTSPPPRRRAIAALRRATAAPPDVHKQPTGAASIVPPPSEVQVGRFSVPDPVQLRYRVTARVKGRELQGSSELRWQHDGQRYEAVFEAEVPALPPRRQHSAGQLASAGLEPQRYAETGRGEQATHFEREARRFIFSNNRPAAALAAGAQDRLSVLLQLSAMLAGDPQRFREGTEIAIQTATTREAGTWLFTVEGEEAQQLPGGELTTVKLVRPPRGEYDLRMEIWLAPGAAYVPVRLRLTQPNGDWIDHQWSTTDRR